MPHADTELVSTIRFFYVHVLSLPPSRRRMTITTVAETAAPPPPSPPWPPRSTPRPPLQPGPHLLCTALRSGSWPRQLWPAQRPVRFARGRGSRLHRMLAQRQRGLPPPAHRRSRRHCLWAEDAAASVSTGASTDDAPRPRHWAQGPRKKARSRLSGNGKSRARVLVAPPAFRPPRPLRPASAHRVIRWAVPSSMRRFAGLMLILVPNTRAESSCTV